MFILSRDQKDVRIGQIEYGSDSPSLPQMPLIIYYNSLCPICDGGITKYRANMINLVKAGEVEYRDINLEPERLRAFGVDIENIRKKLHALDNGELLVGADVAIAIFKLSPGRKWMGHILGFPAIRPFAKMGYHILAQILYAWNRRKGRW